MERTQGRRPNSREMHHSAMWAVGCALVLVFTLRTAAIFPAGAQPLRTAAMPESSVKAAFLYQFVPYIEWPPSALADPAGPIRIGVMGAEPIAARLREIVGDRSVDGRDVQVHSIDHDDSLAGLHMLFIAASADAQASAVITEAEKHSTVTVMESETGLDRGSVITLLIRNGRVRFAISRAAANRIGVKLSSRLLAVAESVRSESP